MSERMVNTDIKAIIRGYILEQFLPGEKPEALSDQTELIATGILDSLASLRLVSFLEERFGVAFKPHEVDVDHLGTVDRIVEVVTAKQG